MTNFENKQESSATRVSCTVIDNEVSEPGHLSDADQQQAPGNAAPRVAVIGGGPAGLAAAARLSEAGILVDLFEAGAELGGLARSITLWGKPVELSAHIFRSNDAFVKRLWRESAGELTELTLRRGIFDGRSVIDYPMTPLRILCSLGLGETLRGLASLVYGRISKRWKPPADNAEDWMVQTYGQPLHQRFLREYAEKLWGMPCKQISASFPKFLFQSAGDSKGDQSFLYPKHGNSSVWKSLGVYLQERGVNIHLNTRVNQMEMCDNKVSALVVNGECIEFDHVISTMPLGLLARLVMPDDQRLATVAAELRARSTVLVYLHAKSQSRSAYNWLSVYPSKFQMGRLTDFGQWLGGEDGTTVFCLEYWCDRDDALWCKSDTDLAELALTELEQTGLVGDVDVLDSHIERLPATHPVFSIGAQSALNSVKDELSVIEGLSSVGRHGSHGVLGMGESMEAARQAVDKALRGLSRSHSSQSPARDRLGRR